MQYTSVYTMSVKKLSDTPTTFVTVGGSHFFFQIWCTYVTPENMHAICPKVSTKNQLQTIITFSVIPCLYHTVNLHILYIKKLAMTNFLYIYYQHSFKDNMFELHRVFFFKLCSIFYRSNLNTACFSLYANLDDRMIKSLLNSADN